jgi:hypothetical protein
VSLARPCESLSGDFRLAVHIVFQCALLFVGVVYGGRHINTNVCAVEQCLDELRLYVFGIGEEIFGACCYCRPVAVLLVQSAFECPFEVNAAVLKPFSPPYRLSSGRSYVNGTVAYNVPNEVVQRYSPRSLSCNPSNVLSVKASAYIMCSSSHKRMRKNVLG